MLIEDFLSANNFHYIFSHLQDIAREKYNYQFELNDKNKKEVGKLMEVIYENNYNSMNKHTANAIIITEIKKNIKKRSQQTFFDNEKVDSLENVTEIRPLIDFNKPSDILSDKFQSIFKKQAKEIERHFVTEKKHHPSELFKDVIKSLEFKEHDLSKAPKNSREELLIPQPDVFKGMFDKPLYIENVNILLDSRDRNNDLYPESENYNIKLDSTFRNVFSIELLQATIPNSDYIINNRNNTIHFEETSGTILEASIPNGNYIDENDIASQLELAMKNIGSSDYNVSFNSITQKFTITSDRTGGSGIFTLKFQGNEEIFGTTGATRTTYLASSIGSILGFNKLDLDDSASHTSQSKSNISTDRSLYLYINADSTDDFKNMESIKTHNNGKFMKVPLSSDLGEPTFWINPRATKKNLTDIEQKNKFQQIPEKSKAEQINKNANDFKLFFNPPISIRNLQIQFKNYNQEYFNFYGHEHSLLFRIEMFNFHYENILTDYNFSDLESVEDTIERIDNETQEMNNPNFINTIDKESQEINN